MSIMIIEDSKPMRNLIKRTLKQAGFGDHEVFEAGDGVEGLELIKSHSPDLVLCDWNMPKMNGMELLKTLKPDVRIVGADHKGKPFTGSDLPIEVYFNTRDHGWSTTDLRNRVYREEYRQRVIEERDELGTGFLSENRY